MKRHSSAPFPLLQILPRGGRLPEGIPAELCPTRGELIKHEPTTLIWHERLANGMQVVAKLYQRGLAVWCRSLATGFRVQHEFDGLGQLEKLGVPCSVPLFWGHGHFGGYGWGEILATEWVANCQSLRNLLATRSEVGRFLDVSPLFADMARMHRAGLHHGMLKTRNILVKNYPERPVFVFIDMPRSHHFLRDIRGTRMAHYDLMSLCQGFLPYFSEDQVLLWLSAYGIPESETVDRLAHLKRFRSTSFVRRVWGAEFNVRNGMTKLMMLLSVNAPKSRQQTGSQTPYP